MVDKIIGKKSAVAEYGQKSFLVRLFLSSQVELTPFTDTGELLSQMLRSQFPVGTEGNQE